MDKRALVLAALLPAAGCAHVSQQDLDTRLEAVRSGLETRMDAGDARLAARMDGIETDVEALRSDLQALEHEFGVVVEEMETALRFNVPVHFGFDRADLDTRAHEILDRFAGVAREHYPAARITVEGFTDPAGSAAYNQRLGMRRAQAVREALVRGGIPSEQVVAVSYGESAERLVAPGTQGPGTEGWENRRVVLVIDHIGGAMGPVVAAGGSAASR